MEPGFWTAVTFLVLGVFLLLVEVLNPGFFIAVPGGTLLLMGGLGLAAPSLMFDSAWSWFLWPAAAVASTGANLYVYKRWAPPGKHPVTLGADSLPGHVGLVTTAVQPGTSLGKVRIKGQTWSARSDQAIPEGRQARVVRVEGVHVIVEPAE